MKQVITVFVFVALNLQSAISQDFQKVSQLANELQLTLPSHGANATPLYGGPVNTKKENGDAAISNGSLQLDSVHSISSTPNATTEEGDASSVNAQVKFGVDLYSRYIWRGLDYGNAPSVQPSISCTIGGLSVGTWAAYSVGVAFVDSFGVGSVFAEHDLWASYSVPTEIGILSLYYTDYYYPSSGLKYFDFNNIGGSHVLEIGAGFSGNEQLPLTITAYYNVHNDPDHSIYLQCGYLYTGELFSANFFAAFTPATSVWYGTTKADLINVGVTFSKAITVSDKLSIPLMVSYIINPHIEQTYLIVGITL